MSEKAKVLLMDEKGKIFPLNCTGQDTKCKEEPKAFNPDVLHVVHIEVGTEEQQHENLAAVVDFKLEPVLHAVIHSPHVSKRLLAAFEKRINCVGGRCTFVQLPS